MLHWDLKFESPSYIYWWQIGGLGQGWIVHNWIRSLSEFLPEILSLYQFGLNYRPYETLSYYPFIKLWPLDYIFILFLTCIPKFVLIGCYFLLFLFFFFININWMLLTVPSKTSCFAYNFNVQKYLKFKCVL